MRTYEERKADAAKKPAKDDKPQRPRTTSAGDKPAPMTGDGMMGGVIPTAAKKDPPKLLPVTAFGRYLKVLLSSNEFLFVN